MGTFFSAYMGVIVQCWYLYLPFLLAWPSACHAVADGRISYLFSDWIPFHCVGKDVEKEVNEIQYY